MLGCLVAGRSGADAYFAELVEHALRATRQPPSLVDVVPLVGRGWRLRFRTGDGRDEIELNAHLEVGASSLGYEYREPEHPSPGRRRYLIKVAQVLCNLLGSAPGNESPPPVPAEDVDPEPRRKSWAIVLDGGCDRDCHFCAQTLEPPAERARGIVILPERTAEIHEQLEARAATADELRVEWSGRDCLRSPQFEGAVRLAHHLGYREMSIQTPGSKLVEPRMLDFLREHGITRVRLTSHAHTAETFDRCAGKPGAYDLFWRAMEELVRRGFELSINVPCTAWTLEELPEHLAHLSARECEINCFHWYPDPEMLGQYEEIGTSYAQTVAALEAAKPRLAAERVGVDGIPECAASAELRTHYRWAYGQGHIRSYRFELLPACPQCPAREHCPGATSVYLEHFGGWDAVEV